MTEAALSPQRQLAVLSRIHDVVLVESQFIIATHLPILMTHPDGHLSIDKEGTRPSAPILPSGHSADQMNNRKSSHPEGKNEDSEPARRFAPSLHRGARADGFGRDGVGAEPVSHL